jgi:hypothetical protein
MKVRVDHLLLGLGALVLLIGSLLAWRAFRPEPEQANLDQGLERLRSKPGSSASQRPRFIRPRGAFSSSEERPKDREGWAEPQTPQNADPGDLDAGEAVDHFKAVIDELEAAVADGRRLSKRERSELYNRATGSFTALSAWTDGSDPNDRALMDDAYARMMSLMRELDIEPPRRDPDGSPIRR